MKTDLIKTYEGNLILPFGTPYVIATAWEDAKNYYAQSVSILDCLNTTIDLSLHYQLFAKSGPKTYEPASLPKDKALKYVLTYGYDMAYKNLPTNFWNYGYSKQGTSLNWTNPNAITIQLKEIKDRTLTLLTHLLRKDDDAFEFLEKHAKAPVLKALIKTAKGYDIETSKTYNKPYKNPER